MNALQIEMAARAAHEANRSWCLAHGDTSQLHWEDAPEWQRESAMNGVRAALGGDDPEQLHQKWCEEKKAAGWKYGPIKSATTKEHPCLVPYSDLPPEQKAKDHLFDGVVKAFLVAIVAEQIATKE